jgi:hypothetical protein
MTVYSLTAVASSPVSVSLLITSVYESMIESCFSHLLLHSPFFLGYILFSCIERRFFLLQNEGKEVAWNKLQSLSMRCFRLLIMMRKGSVVNKSQEWINVSSLVEGTKICEWRWGWCVYLSTLNHFISCSSIDNEKQWICVWIFFLSLFSMTEHMNSSCVVLLTHSSVHNDYQLTKKRTKRANQYYVA